MIANNKTLNALEAGVASRRDSEIEVDQVERKDSVEVLEEQQQHAIGGRAVAGIALGTLLLCGVIAGSIYLGVHYGKKDDGSKKKSDTGEVASTCGSSDEQLKMNEKALAAIQKVNNVDFSNTLTNCKAGESGNQPTSLGASATSLGASGEDVEVGVEFIVACFDGMEVVVIDIENDAEGTNPLGVVGQNLQNTWVSGIGNISWMNKCNGNGPAFAIKYYDGSETKTICWNSMTQPLALRCIAPSGTGGGKSQCSKSPLPSLDESLEYFRDALGYPGCAGKTWDDAIPFGCRAVVCKSELSNFDSAGLLTCNENDGTIQVPKLDCGGNKNCPMLTPPRDEIIVGRYCARENGSVCYVTCRKDPFKHFKPKTCKDGEWIGEDPSCNEVPEVPKCNNRSLDLTSYDNVGKWEKHCKPGSCSIVCKADGDDKTVSVTCTAAPGKRGTEWRVVDKDSDINEPIQKYLEENECPSKASDYKCNGKPLKIPSRWHNSDLWVADCKQEGSCWIKCKSDDTSNVVPVAVYCKGEKWEVKDGDVDVSIKQYIDSDKSCTKTPES